MFIIYIYIYFNHFIILYKKIYNKFLAVTKDDGWMDDCPNDKLMNIYL